MKKFAIIANIGNHEYINGRHVIHGTVNDVELIAESDDRMELLQKMSHSTEYRDNGKWYSLKIETRAEARKTLKRYSKL